VRGALLLAACGDALGARFEGGPRVDPGTVERHLGDPPAELRWTDDTALALVLADHLARRRGTIYQDGLAAGFAAEWARNPDRGYGGGAAKLFAQLNSGTPWPQAARQLFGGQGSLGNGAAMRVAPVGLVADLDLSSVAELARRSAVVTHAHPLAADGAAVQALAVALAARLNRSAPVAVDRFGASITAHVREPEFRAALRQVCVLVRQRAAPEEVAATVGNDVTALGSVPAALTAFLRCPDDPREAVRFAICVGGDTDTIAAMTGALSGARCGEAELPALWTDRLEEGQRLRAVATALAALAAG
jgi:poly(ADP-ribose) glycohydrolase ARH3